MVYVFYALLSALSAAFATLFIKLSVKNSDPITVSTIRSIIATAFLFFFALSMKKFTVQHIFDGQSIFFAILAGTCGGLSWLFYTTALKYGPIAQVATLDRFSLVFVLILSALFLGEYLHIKDFIGVLLILGGAYLITF